MSRKYKEIKNHYKLKSCAKNRNYELKFGFGQATLKCCQGGRLSEGNVQRVPNISSKVYYLRYRYKYLSLSFIKSPDHRVRFLQCFRYKLRTITYRIIILPTQKGSNKDSETKRANPKNYELTVSSKQTNTVRACTGIGGLLTFRKEKKRTKKKNKSKYGRG